MLWNKFVSAHFPEDRCNEERQFWYFFSAISPEAPQRKCLRPSKAVFGYFVRGLEESFALAVCTASLLGVD